MLPRFKADYRALVWALILFPLVPLASYLEPSLLPWLLPLELYLAYCSGALAHNQVHTPMFANQRVNDLYSAWLSLFYGCPIGCWMPTHVVNHHRYANTARDTTRTDRLSSEHNWWQALRYTVACGGWQLPVVVDYAQRMRRGQHRRWFELRLQLSVLLLGQAGFLALALWLHGPLHGALLYLGAVLLPALLAPSFMFFTSYIQHVDCDAESPDNHSRNFVSPIANWLVFQAGYHTVHHEHPNTHWSQYPALHAEREARIHPSLKVPSLVWFCLENYLLRPWDARFGTRPLVSSPEDPLTAT